MKKTLAIAMIGSLAAIANLSAQVNIYIAGSTAFRANAVRAITNLYGANLTAWNDGTTNQVDATGSSAVTFSGTIPSLYSGNTVNIKCYWSGSVQGIHTLNFGENLNFLASSTANTATIDAHTADFTFSDCFQSSTPFQQYTLTDSNVAVLPFVWIRSYGASTNVMDLTMQQVQEALPNGILPLSYLTGIDSDSTNSDGTTNKVYFTGRNTDSGTRVTTDADTFYSGTEKIYLVATSGSTNHAPYYSTAGQVIGGYNYGAGYTGGSALRSAVIAATTNTVLGYLGYPDSVKKLGPLYAGGNTAIISYNGTLPYYNGLLMATNNNGVAILTTTNFPDFSPVTRGQYSYWCYEHALIGGKNTPSANAVTLFTYMCTNGVDADLKALEVPASGGPVSAIRLSEMKVRRTVDGGPITP